MQEPKWVCLDNTKKCCKDDRNINTILLFRALFVKCILAAWFSSVRGMFFDSFTHLHTDILMHIYADIPWISGDLGTALELFWPVLVSAVLWAGFGGDSEHNAWSAPIAAGRKLQE